MSKKNKGLTAELRNAIIWLEKQPGVSAVVQGRYTRTRHHHKPGWTRVSITDARSVHLRTYDAKGMLDLFAHAPSSPLRDRWVAALASGDIIEAGKGPDLQPVRDAVQATIAKAAASGGPKTSPRLAATPVNDHAGQLYDVTPELAAKWLERNTRNRDLRQSVVERYAADMRAGRWMVTGDAIAFDRNGVVINGQHRLWAVLEAGITVRMIAVFDLEPETVSVLDDHLKRNLRDVARIANPSADITAKHASIARAMQFASIWMTSADSRAAIARLSRQQQLDFMSAHGAAIHFAIADCFRSTSKRGLTTATVLAPVARAYYTASKDRLKAFGRTILSGEVDDPQKDRAAIILRNWLMRMDRGQARAPGEVIYRKTARAIQAFLKGEAIATLYEASTELFLLPEDERPTRRKAS